MIRITQINLHHCIVATTNLILYLNRHDIDVALIQEPWINGDEIMGLEHNLYKLIKIGNTNKPRACIMIKNNVNCFTLTQHCCRDLMTISVEINDFQFIIASAYFPHGDDCEPPPRAVRDLARHCEEKGIEFVVGCDANSHNILWGSTDTNDRGQNILDFIIENNLTIYNTGGEYTFQTKNRKEVLDLTFGSIKCLTDWEVSNEVSFSDHKYIDFSIDYANVVKNKFYRNPRKTDWDKFKRLISRKLGNKQFVLEDTEAIETSLNTIVDALTTSFRKSCPVSKTGTKKNQPWWSPELRALRQEARRAFNKARKEGRDELWLTYRNKLRIFKKEIRKAKEEYHEDLIGELTNIKDTSRLRKLMSKQEHTINNLRNSDNTWTNTSEETLTTLLKTHFPGCVFGRSADEGNTQYTPRIHSNITGIVTYHSLHWAVNTFGPYKSPGMDGIYPKMLQESVTIIGNTLIDILNFCLENTYVPKSWREIKVVFIPKAGKIQHNTVKDYRPISLSSFMLKTLERILDEFVRDNIGVNHLSGSQHAYIKGRSVDSALHSVVHHIERSLLFKDYTMGAFLDVEGAFNNIKSSAIQIALTQTGIDNNITLWLLSMLEQRYITSELGETRMRVKATRGTPQGGVISPLLWLLVMNEILCLLDAKGIKVVAYADDLVLLVSGKFLNSVSDILNSSLKMLSTWAEKCGLNVNPEKTELVLFTRRMKIPPFSLPKLNGVSLMLSNSAKFLGIILDRKLDWRENLNNRIRKAYAALYSCQKLLGSRGRLKPKLVYWLYTAVVRPVATYGCHVWWPILTHRVHSSAINRLNRVALLSITGAMRTTPTAAMEIALNIAPMDVHVLQTAKVTLIRLREASSLMTRYIGHSDLISDTVEICSSDYTVPYNMTRGKWTVVVPSLNDWAVGKVKFSKLNIFTDGSKMTEGTGCGVFCNELELEKSYRLRNDCSIFQAEVYAIAMAARLISEFRICSSDISFFVDSQAAIMALRSNNIRSKVVSNCHKELDALCEQHKVTICWVPGHKGIEGNEKADELAKRGASLPLEVVALEVFPPLSLSFHHIRQEYRLIWMERWNTSDTCRQTKFLWDESNVKYSKTLLEMSRIRLRKIIYIITGHNTLGKHMVRLGIIEDDTCRWCGEATEDSFHYLCECPALANRRFNVFGSYFFQSLLEIRGLNPELLLEYIKASRWND